MTKEKLRRYFELDRDLADSGRLDPGDPDDGPRLLEYRQLAEEFDAWEPEQERQDMLTLWTGCLSEFEGRRGLPDWLQEIRERHHWLPR